MAATVAVGMVTDAAGTVVAVALMPADVAGTVAADTWVAVAGMPVHLARFTVAADVVMPVDRAECALTAVAHLAVTQAAVQRLAAAADSAVEHAAALVAAAASTAAAVVAAPTVVVAVVTGNIGAFRI